MPKRSFSRLIPAVLVAICGLSATSIASAQPLAGSRVYVKFGTAVRVPGATLRAGEYLFVLAKPVAGQGIIDIYRGGDSTLVVSCLGIETLIAQPAAMILEYSGSTPPALRAWFHPGNVIGFEFVYGEPEAKAINRASGQSVPFGLFTRITHEMVGTVAVAVAASPAPGSPPPVETTGTLPQSVQAHTAGEHLAAARAAIAKQLPAVESSTGGRLRLLGELLERLDDAYRGGSTSDVRRELLLITNTLGSILPLNSSTVLLSGVPPMDVETMAVLARVRAHLHAFAVFIR